MRMTKLRISLAFFTAIASPIAAALAHGEGLQTGTQWTCVLDAPLYNHTGAVGITLLDETGIDAPNVALMFEDGTRITHILSSNWADGLVFIENGPDASELTLIRNNLVPTEFDLMLWLPATERRRTAGICEET